MTLRFWHKKGQLGFSERSFKSSPDSLKQRFKAFGRKQSLGAPGLDADERSLVYLQCIYI